MTDSHAGRFVFLVCVGLAYAEEQARNKIQDASATENPSHE